MLHGCLNVSSYNILYRPLNTYQELASVLGIKKKNQSPENNSSNKLKIPPPKRSSETGPTQICRVSESRSLRAGLSHRLLCQSSEHGLEFHLSNCVGNVSRGGSAPDLPVGCPIQMSCLQLQKVWKNHCVSRLLSLGPLEGNVTVQRSREASEDKKRCPAPPSPSLTSVSLHKDGRRHQDDSILSGLQRAQIIQKQAKTGHEENTHTHTRTSHRAQSPRIFKCFI